MPTRRLFHKHIWRVGNPRMKRESHESTQVWDTTSTSDCTKIQFVRQLFFDRVLKLNKNLNKAVGYEVLITELNFGLSYQSYNCLVVNENVAAVSGTGYLLSLSFLYDLCRQVINPTLCQTRKTINPLFYNLIKTMNTFTKSVTTGQACHKLLIT